MDKWLKPAETLLRDFVATAPLEQAAAVSDRKTEKLRHFTIMFCFSALGMDRVPMIVLPNLVLVPAMLRAIEDYCSNTATKNGWVNGEAWMEWVIGFCEWVVISAGSLRMGRSLPGMCRRERTASATVRGFCSYPAQCMNLESLRAEFM
jgi:hypothetical protein